MSKDDTASSLLSKLVKFVRNPATNWTELDSVDGDKDDAVTKQLLNEMIERKRRNDFVRKREFDMLRKLRKLEILAGTPANPGGRPSFFQSSITSNVDDRATTLRKIDEIEAQMSMQWWKAKHHQTVGGAATEPAVLPGADAQSLPKQRLQPGELPAAYHPTLPAVRDSLHAADESAHGFLIDDLLGGLAKNPVPNAIPGLEKPAGSALERLPSQAPAHLENEPVIHDAELEEAAILFANGDDVGAEAGLLEMLRPAGSHADHADAWLTLFDFYRATGEQGKFEAAALNFAQQFNRSAPQWFSLPELVRAMAQQPEAKPKSEHVVADWVCPAVLGPASIGALNDILARVPMPWRLDWSHLKTIEAAALEPLLKVFGNWAAQPVQLRFLGHAQLQQVLSDASPSGDRGVPSQWWLLRLKMLCVIHRPDDFELTALDFCVTYEVSPPAWEPARCDCKLVDDEDDAMGLATIIGAPSTETVHSTLMEFDPDSGFDVPAGNSFQVRTVDLSGQIQGDAVGVLDRLEASLMGADRMQISCAKLIRVDFSAAGMLLNWVSARQAENRFVEFSEVNRLVAAFFNVIGIVEHAKISPRTD